jgi:hypothetical protein
MSNTGIAHISWGIHDGKVRVQVAYKGLYKALYAKGPSYEDDEELLEEAKKVLKEFMRLRY